MTDRKRYYLHKKLKPFVKKVKARQKTIEVAQDFISPNNKVSYYIAALIKQGYNFQYSINN